MMGDAGVHGDTLAPSTKAWQRSRAKQAMSASGGRILGEAVDGEDDDDAKREPSALMIERGMCAGGRADGELTYGSSTRSSVGVPAACVDRRRER